MAMPTFGDMIGPEQLFLREYFGRRPLLRTGALTDHLGWLPTDVEMMELTSLEAMRPSYVRLIKSGKAVSPKAYTKLVRVPGTPLGDMLVPEKVDDLFRAGATVVWNYLDHFLPAMRTLQNSVGAVFAAPGETVVFLTPPNQRGFTVHHDPVDIFVTQVQGAKTWRLWDRNHARRGKSVVYEDGQLGEADLTITLRPGDVLYIPPGTPHVADSLDSASLHVSISVELRRWREIIGDCVQRLMTDDCFHDRPFLGRGGEDRAASDLDQVLRALQRLLTDVDPITEIRRLSGTQAERAGLRTA